MGRMLYLGDDVTLPGSGYPPLAAFQIPYPASLNGAFFLGNGEGIGLRNWAGGADAVPVGSPAWGSSFVTLSQDGYLQTDINETLAMSLFIVGRETTANSVGWIGNYLSGGAFGVSMYTGSGGTSMQANVGRAGGTGGSVSVTSNTAQWGVYSLQIPATGAAMLRNHTSGTGNLTTATANREINGAGPLRIGRLPSPSYGGANDQVIALVYNRALSDAETRIVAAFCRDYANSRGVPVAVAS